MSDETFDVVVVGGGSAGCVAAAHLVGAGLRVCLVEAGPDYGPCGDPRWPADLLDPRRLALSHDWGYEDRSAGSQGFPEWRARVIGGCSSHNQCATAWAPAHDYDRWATLAGDRRWTAAAVRPLFDDIEDAQGGCAWRGHGGTIPTRRHPVEDLSSFDAACLRAFEARFGALDDVADPEAGDGAAPVQANVVDGLRWNASFAFLDPIRDSGGLVIVDRALADRLELRPGGRADALVVRRNGRQERVRGRSFVLAGGTFGAPAVLLRSGVGPAEPLRALGLDVVRTLPGVGENLQEHVGVELSFAGTARAVADQARDVRTGRYHVSQVTAKAHGGALHIVSFQPELGDGAFGFSLAGFVLAPASRGRMRLVDKDCAAAPQIALQRLTDPGGRDMTTLVASVGLMREVARLEPLAELLGEELARRLDDDALVHAHSCGYGHHVGTCRMGPADDPLAVVSGAGSVHGLDNVWVADASIIPDVPHVPTNFSAMLVARVVAAAVAAA